MGQRRAPLIALLATVAAAGALVMAWATALGAGLVSDSLVYVDAARSVLAGRGLVALGEPMVHYPPGYPLLLAAGGLAGLEPLDGARMLEVALYAANAALVALVAWVAAERSLAAAGAAALLFLGNASMLEVHAWAGSDPLCLACALVALLAAARHAATGHIRPLALAALAAAAALVTRYVGVTLLPALLAAVLLSPASTRERARNAALLLALSCGPLLLALARNALIGASATGRHLVFHPVQLVHLTNLLDTLFQYWLPTETAAAYEALALGAGLAVAGALVAWLVRRTGEPDLLVLIALAFVATYLPFLFLSISFADAHTPLDARMLAPVQAVVWALVAALVARAAARHRNRLASLVALATLAAVASANVGPATWTATGWHVVGHGFQDRDWRASPVLRSAAALPSGLVLYSNGPEPLRFLTGRPARSVPPRVLPNTLERNPDYERDVEAMSTEVRSGAAAVVWFDRITWRWYLPARQDLEVEHHLPVLSALEDGAVLGKGAAR